MNFRLKTQFTKTFIGMIALSSLCWAVSSRTQLLKCESKSLGELRYLLILKGTSFKRGDIVSIKDFSTPYKGSKLIAKRVLGLPGDLILKRNKKLRIITRNDAAFNLQSISLPLLQETREGKPLTPISRILIPKGYVFVAGHHPRSFDSRYEEFGLVPVSKIWGRSVWSW